MRKKAEAHLDDPVVLSLARSGVRIRDISTGEGQIAESYYNYNPVEEGDFLLNPMDLYSGANCSISHVNGVISPAYINLRAKKGFDAAYYDYYFKTQYWSMVMFAHGKGVSFDNRWTLNANDLLNFAIPLPSYKEQTEISSYLNKMCACVDEVMEKTQASIEEYKKLKLSVITQAVKMGIHGNRKTKISGVNWVDAIPENWHIVKVTRILDYSHPYPIGDGDHGLVKTEDYKNEGIPYLRVQNIGWGTPLTLDNVVYISEEKNEQIKNSTLFPNDILFAKTGATIGKTAIVPPEIPISNTTSHIGKITVSKDYWPKYVFYFLSSSFGYRQFWEIAIQKTTRPELAIDEIKQIKILIPPYEEQIEIASYIDDKCSEIDSLILKKEQILTDLINYKKSMIYEYITGKKEVKK